MYRQEAYNEYLAALKAGQRVYKQRQAAGQEPHLPQLPAATATARDLGLVEIPAERIVGVSSASRAAAFTGDFLPLLGPDTEFGQKWIALCAAHLDEGIQEPVSCYEYLGDFYVIEGHKRVSVLRCLGAARIFGEVQRILPAPDGQPRTRAYLEFLDFYRSAGLYDVQFRRPGDYEALLACLGKQPDEAWSTQEQQAFRSAYAHFREAFGTPEEGGPSPEEALLLWLQTYGYDRLRAMPAKELKKSLLSLEQTPAPAEEAEPEKKASLLTRIIRPEHRPRQPEEPPAETEALP